MKRIANKIVSPLQRLPIETGERWAWWLLLFFIGFGIGWAASSWRWLGTMCFPIV